MPLRCLAPLVLLLAAARRDEVSHELLRDPAPADVSEAVRKELAATGSRILKGGKPFADLWLRATLPTAAPHPGPGVLYPTLQPAGLVGVVRFHAGAADFKSQKVPAGVYTLRYAVQPDDGDHQDTAPSRDFLLLCPAAGDAGPAVMELKELQKISARIHDRKHPAVLHLTSGQGGALPRVVHDAAAERVVVEVDAPAAGGTTLRLSIVLVGKPPEDGPDFGGLAWVDARPELQGKVTLVRWWTNGCALCSSSVPALAELAKKAPLVAVYHPKPPRDTGADEVRAFAKQIGMPGTLAVDRDWTVLDRWMPPGKRSFTSLTFLLDRKGRVRRVHPGGAIDAEAAKELSQQIDALLAEKE